MKKSNLLAIVSASIIVTTINFNAISKETKRLEGKNILMIIASKDFRDEEYSIPKLIFEEQGAKIKTASTTLNKVKGMLGKITVKPDININKVKAGEYDAIIFVGGAGASEYWNNKTAHNLIKTAYKSNKVIGAICIVPVTLAKSGILKGKKATVWESEAEQLEEQGAIYENEDVVIDGNIITANGPSAAEDFAVAISEMLTHKK